MVLAKDESRNLFPEGEGETVSLTIQFWQIALIVSIFLIIWPMFWHYGQWDFVKACFGIGCWLTVIIFWAAYFIGRVSH